MSNKTKVLRRVSDRFSLFDDGRKVGANKRRYLVNAVRSMIAATRTQESLRLGESFGYYGHGSRQRANKLDLGETEVVMINGKAVLVENVPSNRTIAIEVSDDGVVSHTQEILDTPSGRIIDSLERSKAGGWSWATGGRDSVEAAITTSYHGMDYVLKPNFISLDHPQMMMESAESQEEMLLESVIGSGIEGIDKDSAGQLVNLWSRPSGEFDGNMDVILENMALNSMVQELQADKEALQQRDSMLLEAVEKLPVYVTDEQKAALLRMQGEDIQVVHALFESAGDPKIASLPLGSQATVTVPASVNPKAIEELKRSTINFGSRSKLFS